MGSYTAADAPMNVVIPSPRQKSPIEVPKIKLRLDNQKNAVVRLPCSTVTNSKSRISLQQVPNLKQLHQANQGQPLCQLPQLKPVHIVNQLDQSHEALEPQLKPVHLVDQPTQANKVQEQQDLYESQNSPEKSVTFADVTTDQYGRCSPIHCGIDSRSSTPSPTDSEISSPVQSTHGDQSTTILANRRSSSPTQIIQTGQSTALVAYGNSSQPAMNVHKDQSLAILSERRPSITHLVVYQPQQQIIPKTQGHKIRIPNNKRKASLPSPPSTNNMQLSFFLPNQQQMVGTSMKQIDTQQYHAPQGYKSARKGSLTGQNIVIKIVIK